MRNMDGSGKIAAGGGWEYLEAKDGSPEFSDPAGAKGGADEEG